MPSANEQRQCRMHVDSQDRSMVTGARLLWTCPGRNALHHGLAVELVDDDASVLGACYNRSAVARPRQLAQRREDAELLVLMALKRKQDRELDASNLQ